MCLRVQFIVPFLTLHLGNHVCDYVLVVLSLPAAHALSYFSVRPSNKNLYETKILPEFSLDF